jgi:hypothetical protein
LIQFINPAKRGNGLTIGNLFHLFKHAEAPQLLNDILDIYFSNLRAELIPPSAGVDQRSPLALANMERGIESARGLAAYIRFCFDASPRKTQTLVAKLRSRMTSRVSDIFLWLRYLTLRPISSDLADRNIRTGMNQQVTLISQIIEGCINLDPGHLRIQILACTEASDLMTRLWQLKNKDVFGNAALDGQRDDQYLMYLLDEDFTCCPILNLMAIFLSDPQGKETLLQQWFFRINDQGKDKRKLDPSVHLANTILSRLAQIEDAVDQRTCSLRIATSNFTTIEAILNALTQVMKERKPGFTIEREVYTSLDKRRYLFLYMKCLNAISRHSLEAERSTGFRFSPNDEPALPVVCLGRALGELFHTVSRTSHSLLTHLAEWISGGLIAIVANCAIVLRHYPDSARKFFPTDFDPLELCSAIPRLCLTYALYPPVLRATASSISEDVLTEEQIKALSWAMAKDQGTLYIDEVKGDWMASVMDYLSRCSNEVRESQRYEVTSGRGSLCDCSMVCSTVSKALGSLTFISSTSIDLHLSRAKPRCVVDAEWPSTARVGVKTTIGCGTNQSAIQVG